MSWKSSWGATWTSEDRYWQLPMLIRGMERKRSGKRGTTKDKGEGGSSTSG